MWYDGDIVLKQIYLIFILNITHITNKVIWIWANLSILSRNLSILSNGITLLYGWRILCCFFPCFLILASGQFLNIAGWISFYATIHVYTIFFLLIFKLGHSNVSNINSVSLRNTVRFVFICKIFVISNLEFLFIGFAGSRRFDSLDFDWLKLMKVLLL